MSSELKPCPFCGCQAHLAEEEYPVIKCLNPKCKMAVILANTKEKAVSMWNNRVDIEKAELRKKDYLNKKLLPCPFCGGTDIRVRHGLVTCWKYVQCKCGAETASSEEVVAIEAWNTRPEPELATIEAIDSAIDVKYAEIERLVELEWEMLNMEVESLKAESSLYSDEAIKVTAQPDLSTIEQIDSAIDAKYAEIEKLMEMWRNRKEKAGE